MIPRLGASRSNPVPGGMILIVLGLTAWFLYAVRSVLSPFLVAAVLAYLLNPVVSFFEVRGIRRERAVVVLFLFLLVAMTGLVYWGLVAVWQDIPDLRDAWPEYSRRAREAVLRVQKDLEFEWPQLRESHVLERALEGSVAWVQARLFHSTTVMTSVVRFVVDMVLAPFIAFFFLRGGGRVAQMALDACPGGWVERFLSLLNKFGWVVGHYARGILLEAFLVGVCSILALHAMGLDYAGLIGIVAGVGNMIPFFGPVLGGALGVVAAVFQYSNLEGPLRVALIFLVIHYVDSYIFQPLIMQRSVDLNPVTVVLALLCGAQLGGVWGLVLAVPVAGLVKESAVVFFAWYRAERGLIVPAKEIALAASRPWVV